MTGLWQVNGKNRTTFREMIRFDIAYARRISPWMDFKILLKTAPAICMQLGDHVARKESGERKATGGGG
jgi:lipopolysaccharide/colanic/teichoic acid biosynthesis glycosyltransferase